MTVLHWGIVMSHLELLLDFFSTLAMLALLASSYRFVRQTVRSAAATQLLLGVMFGGIAFLQMHVPLTIMPGVIVDMRHVPVLLAGAYLGGFGVLPCVAIAVAARYAIGGVGMEAGVVGLMLAGCNGFAWGEAMRHRIARPALALLGLGLAGVLRLVVLVLLPPAAMTAFVTQIVPVLIPLEIAAILLIGGLLEREGTAAEGERRLRAAASTDPGSGLLTIAGLQRAFKHLDADDAPTRGTGIVLARLRNRGWILREYGTDDLDRVLGALRQRLERDLPRGDLLGLTDDGDIVVFLTDRDARSQEGLIEGMIRELCLRPVALGGSAEARVSLEVGHTWDVTRRPLDQQLAEAAASLVHNARLRGDHPGKPFETARTGDVLFERAQRLLT